MPVADLPVADFPATRFAFANPDLRIDGRTLVMGILNVTPDSFFDGGKYDNAEAAIARAERLVEDGADILDVGGESTRPASEALALQQELDRVIPFIEALRRRVAVPISIDTYKSAVARAACSAGATIINDIGGLRFDDGMADAVRDTGAGYVLMHNANTWKTMHEPTIYPDVTKAVIDDLSQRLAYAASKGIAKDKIVVDPGIGFAKSTADNLILHKTLGGLRILGAPIMFASSSKRFIGEALGLDKDQRLEATIASCVVAVMNGANIIRVHDVKEVKRALRLVDAIQASKAVAGNIS
jgi:dihydropteroate synthase